MIGKTLSITYYKDFLWYRHYLKTGMASGKKSVQNIFYNWNKALFPALFKPTFEDHSDEELRAAFAEMQTE